MAARRPRADRATARATNASATTSNGSGAPTKLSAAASAIAALSAWCAPCSGRNTSGYSAPGLRRSTRRPPIASTLRATPKSSSRRTTGPSASRCSKIAWMSGSVSPSTSVAPGFRMPGLLVRDLLARRPEVLDVIDGHVGDDRDATVDDVRRVPRAAHPDLDDRDVDGFVGEPAERGRGDDVEVRRVDADRLLDERDRVQHLLERLVVDRFAVDRHALVDVVEVRARVRADLQAERARAAR